MGALDKVYGQIPVYVIYKTDRRDEENLQINMKYGTSIE